MKKNIIIIFSAIIIFFMPVQNGLFPNEAHAITGKVISLAAKKIAKEVVKDAAIQTAGSLALKAFVDERLQSNVKEGFKLTCLPGGLSSSGECTKPVQIKEVLTEADKSALGQTVDIELEKAINGGVGFNKFQKFVDWIAPLFLVTLTLTAITYAIDPDVKSLFDEIAVKALTALGFLIPVTDPNDSNEPKNLDEISIQEDKVTSISSLEANGIGTNLVKKLPNNTYRIDNIMSLGNITTEQKQNMMIKQTYQNITNNRQGDFPNNKYEISDNNGINGMFFALVGTGNIEVTSTKFGTINNITEYRNGVFHKTYTNGTNANGKWNYQVEGRSLPNETTSIFRMPYFNGDFWITDIFLNHNNPSFPTIQYQVQHTQNNIDYSFSQIRARTEYSGYASYLEMHSYTTVDTTQSPYRETLLPSTEELGAQLKPTEQSQYFNGDEVTLVPPASLPYTQPNGQPAYPEPNPEYDPITNPNADPNIWRDPNGDIIQNPEDLTVGDPIITQDPWGNPQVEPPPSPTNPTPEPTPLGEPKVEPNIPTDQPIFPKGQSCSEGLKLPKINPLTQAVTTAFPFSIPFDLYKGFQALFSEIGTEKPSFNLVIGDSIDWKITIPDYFDSWKRFSDSILIFVFDVGLIYAIYRFMSGGGS